MKQLKGFLGLMGYYRRFVHHYAHIAWPLTEMLKSNNFTWTLVAKITFQQLKTALTNTQVLALLDFSQAFVVETDVSTFGVGAVLS